MFANSTGAVQCAYFLLHMNILAALQDQMPCWQEVQHNVYVVEQGRVSTEQTACHSELQRLQAVVTNQENEVAAHRARIAKLESLHKLAQDSALACESELVSCQHALASCQQQNQKLLSELQNSK